MIKWENMLGRKGKSNASKINNTTRKSKPECTVERKKTKKISRQDQTMQTKQ